MSNILNGAVLSDVDGTIVRRSLVLEHAAFLHNNGVIDVKEELNSWRRSVKNEDRIAALAEAYRNGIMGKYRRDLMVSEYLDSVMSNENNFYSTLNRLKEFSAQGWPVYLISGSPSFLISPFARRLGFLGKGTTYRVDADGKLTGLVVPMFTATAKEKHLTTLSLDQFEKIVAFGDTSSDMPLFANAHYSVLVDPNRMTRMRVKADEILKH